MENGKFPAADISGKIERRKGGAETFPRLGALWGVLPADTRMPHHPLLQHLSATAALADALPQPALLAFPLGPVQEFIAAARRTQDLR